MHRGRRPAARIRPALALLAAGAAAAALGACGGAGSPSARSLLDQTFESHEPIDSGRVELSTALSGTRSADHGPARTLFSALVQGPFQSVGPARVPNFALLVDLCCSRPPAAGRYSPGRALAFAATSTDGRLFIELGATTFAAPASALRALERGYAQTARSRDASGTSSPLSTLGIDAGRWLTSPMLAGSATLAGERTLHVVAGVDVRRLLADAQTLFADGGALGLGAGGGWAPLSPARVSALSRSVRSARADVYTGARDHQLRRLSLSASIATDGRARAALDGLRTARLTFVLQLAELNRPQRITAPSDPVPLSALGAALAHSESSSRSTPSSSSSSSSRSSSGSGSPPAP